MQAQVYLLVSINYNECTIYGLTLHISKYRMKCHQPNLKPATWWPVGPQGLWPRLGYRVGFGCGIAVLRTEGSV
jgi:hypothetical protein